MNQASSTRPEVATAPARWQQGLPAGSQPMPQIAGPHWYGWRTPDQVVWLIFDRAGESTNTLSASVLQALQQALGVLLALPPAGMVLASAKASGFAAGADVRDFQAAQHATEVAAALQQAHQVIDQLAALPWPTVAVVHGHCLGGGLELALACRYRVLTPDANLGLPEVLLGLHPGLGGTFRLPQRIDPLQALTLMLTGKTVSARRALALGLADQVLPERHVAAAVQGLLQSGQGAARPGGLQRWRARILRTGLARRALAAALRRFTAQRANPEHYPAPYRLIELWARHGHDPAAQQQAEIRSFSELLVSPTAQALQRVFFLRERLRSAGKAGVALRQVHVVGAGVMGSGIAAWCAARGLRVTLADRDPQALAAAVQHAHQQVFRRLPNAQARREAADRLVPDAAGAGVAAADLVIEAIAESAEAKRALYASLWPQLAPHAILATNTSSLPLEVLRQGLPDPGRFAGIHFFNPVHRMMLVEVVQHDQLAPATLTQALHFCRQLQRLPVSVASSPGFVVNRALSAYLVEAFLLRQAGVSDARIDQAATQFGMPMGPLALADQVGLDVCLAVARSLRQAFPQEVPEIPGWLEAKVAAGELGVKTGRGIYRYRSGGQRMPAGWRARLAWRSPSTVAPSELRDRLVLPLLNTGMRLLREGVIGATDDFDAAMIFGTGFAPFRGGPMHYARQRGVDQIVQQLQAFASLYGPRFEPDPGWQDPAWWPRT